MLELFVSASLPEFRYENVHSMIMQVQGCIQSTWQCPDDKCRIERDHWLPPRHRQCSGNDEQDTRDKEPVDDFWLGPPELLEMMVYRSHKEDPLSAARGFKASGRRKRIFLMAPIHHHFEKLGWTEPKIVDRFFVVSILFVIAGALTMTWR